MNIFKTVSLVCCILFSAAIYAQDKATVKGNIKDAKTGEPLYGVNVYTNTNQGTTTDFDGDFNLKLDPGTYDIKISFVSYKDIVKKSVTLTAGQVLELVEKLESQTIELGITVVSASKYEKKLSEETVSMDVLGAQLIQNSNSLQAEDAMEKVPGVTVVDGQANIRGGSGWSYGAGSRVAVLLDDMPFMSSDASDAKWSAMATEHVEQVEVIKGAASALYGSSALNGIINLRTAWPKNEPVTKVTMFTGVSQNPQYESLVDSFTYTEKYYDNPANPTDSINSTNTIPVGEGMWYGKDIPRSAGFQISHRRKIKSFDFIIGGNFYTTKSHLLGGGGTDTRISGKLRYRPKNVRGLSTGVNYSINNNIGSTFFLWNGLDSLAYIPFPGTVSEYYSLRVSIDPYLVYFDKNDNQYSFKGRYFNSKNTNNTGQGSVPQMFQGEFQYQRMFVPIKLNIVGGVYGYYSWINPPKGSTGSLFGSATANNAALFFQADKKFFDKLSVAAGVRFEHFRVETYKGQSNPLFRFGLNYQAAEATYIRASWGQGYRFPTIAEKFINTNVGIIGIYPNPNITPETGWSAELGIKQGVKLGDWMGYADVSGFINRYSNMMEFTFGPFGNPPALFDPARHNPDYPEDPLFGLGFSSQNVGETRILGVEFTLMGTGKLWGKIPMSILAGYTFIDPKSLNWDDPIDLYDRYGNQVNDPAVVDSNSFFYEFIPQTYAETSSSTENVLKYRNKHTFKLDIEWQFLKEKVGLGFSVQYTSFMENIDKIFVEDFVYFEQIGLLGNTNVFSALKTFREKNDRGNTLFDGRISYRFTPKAKLTFLCKNIINQQIMERPGYLSGPRTFLMQLDMEF